MRIAGHSTRGARRKRCLVSLLLPGSAGVEGSRARWRRPFTVGHIRCALARVFLGAWQLGSFGCGLWLAGGPFLKELFQEGATPATTRARAETLAQLAFPLRLVDPDVIDDLAAGDVKAQAEFVVGFHVQASVAVARRKPMRQAL